MRNDLERALAAAQERLSEHGALHEAIERARDTSAEKFRVEQARVALVRAETDARLGSGNGADPAVLRQDLATAERDLALVASVREELAQRLVAGFDGISAATDALDSATRKLGDELARSLRAEAAQALRGIYARAFALDRVAGNDDTRAVCQAAAVLRLKAEESLEPAAEISRLAEARDVFEKVRPARMYCIEQNREQHHAAQRRTRDESRMEGA